MDGFRLFHYKNQSHIERLSELVKVYKDAICFGINIVTATDINNLIKQEEETKLYREKIKTYTEELKNINITIDGEFFYKGEIHHAKDSIACMIKQHIEILENYVENYFEISKEISEYQKGYITFLNEYVEYIRSNK